MATLAELFSGSDSNAGPTGNMRTQYLDYVIACEEAGKKPLPFDDWLKAGKPKV